MIFKKSTVFANIIIPIILGSIWLNVYLNRILKAGEPGLGPETSFKMGEFDNYPLQIMQLDMTDSLKKGWELRGRKPLTLWFGNSQLNGVNQYKPGQKNCIEFIFDSVKQNKNEVLGVGFPNGNFQEFLLSLLYLTNKMPVKNIVIPVFYDDMREDGIRKEINTTSVYKTIRDHPELIHYYAGFREIEAVEKMNSDTGFKANDMKALEQTDQEYSEKYLEHCLENSSVIWEKRKQMRDYLFIDLYRYRNSFLNIKPTTIRRMIVGRYNSNYRAFLSMISYCRDKGIRLFVYIPPLRSDVAPPYNMSEYNRFKISIQQDCLKQGVDFLNLENLVPAKYWGKKAGTSSGVDEEIDFMHFQETGHHLIADTIYSTLLKAIP